MLVDRVTDLVVPGSFSQFLIVLLLQLCFFRRISRQTQLFSIFLCFSLQFNNHNIMDLNFPCLLFVFLIESLS